MLFNFCRVLIILVPLFNITVFCVLLGNVSTATKKEFISLSSFDIPKSWGLDHFLQATIELSCCWSWWRRLSIAVGHGGPTWRPGRLDLHIPNAYGAMKNEQLLNFLQITTNHFSGSPPKKKQVEWKDMDSYIQCFPVAQWSHCWIKIIPLWSFTSVPLWGFFWMHALSPFELRWKPFMYWVVRELMSDVSAKAKMLAAKDLRKSL